MIEAWLRNATLPEGKIVEMKQSRTGISSNPVTAHDQVDRAKAEDKLRKVSHVHTTNRSHHEEL